MFKRSFEIVAEQCLDDLLTINNNYCYSFFKKKKLCDVRHILPSPIFNYYDNNIFMESYAQSLTEIFVVFHSSHQPSLEQMIDHWFSHYIFIRLFLDLCIYNSKLEMLLMTEINFNLKPFEEHDKMCESNNMNATGIR